VLLWACIGFAFGRLRLTQRLANGVFLFYGVLVTGVLVAGIVAAVKAGESAVPFSAGDALTLDFGQFGWIFGLVLLYLLGVETPFNMGAEFVTPASSKKMVAIGSVALAVGYLMATVGILVSTPLDALDPITGTARVFDIAGAPARYRFADRYEGGGFWRIPGGRVVAVLVALVGIAGTTAGIYYTYTLPFSPDIEKGTWMANVGVICAVTLAAAGLVYVLGRRSAAQVSDAERLAHLATLDALPT